jgi:DNA-binding NarL/FixJ family response regulator
MPIKKIKLVLAEECELFTDGFRQLIKNDRNKEIDLLSTVNNYNDLLKIIKKHKPHVVAMIYNLRGINTLQLCKMIKSKFPKTGLLILTLSNEENFVIEMLLAGANGYVSKNESKESLLEAIKVVAEGSRYVSTSITNNLLDQFSRVDSNKRRNQIHFTTKELNIINYICNQYTTKEIADTLDISIRTVEDYRHNIQEKMGVKNVAGLVLFAVQNNLLLKENYKTNDYS